MKKFTLGLGILVAALSAQAKIVTKAVPYEHEGVKLQGYLAYDDEVKSPRPGVMLIHEWWGLDDYTKNRAEAVAKLGYVAFAADMYGAGVVTDSADKAKQLSGPFYGKPLMAERARAGLDQFLKSDLVNPKEVAVIGYCFGGTTALVLAYSGAPLEGVVTIHGGLVSPQPGVLDKTKAKFLILQGGIDPFVKPEDIAALKKAMDDAGTDYQFVSYSGAVHAFSNPGADALAKKNKLEGIGYNEPAARRSWQATQNFLAELFGQK